MRHSVYAPKLKPSIEPGRASLSLSLALPHAFLPRYTRAAAPGNAKSTLTDKSAALLRFPRRRRAAPLSLSYLPLDPAQSNPRTWHERSLHRGRTVYNNALPSRSRGERGRMSCTVTITVDRHDATWSSSKNARAT